MTQSKKGRYVYCYECGCRKEKNGVCEICGHIDNPLLAGMIPDVTGLTEIAAKELLTGPEGQLTLGTITTENSETVAEGLVISSTPVAGVQCVPGRPVGIVVSLGPAG
ncbi:PASTA domain-containing protein [Candidatus Pacearchaeota archaeon]|nr:PASTA domain-containing protein [Candidatus Pacearchaeota archaeon]